MVSSIYTLEALLELSPDKGMRTGNRKMWRALWEDASNKISAYLRSVTIAACDDESLTAELLAAERSKLHNEIQKISTFHTEAGDALWENSSSLYMVATNIRCLVQALRSYVEKERRFMIPQRGAAV
jgi:hypothetical protein